MLFRFCFNKIYFSERGCWKDVQFNLIPSWSSGGWLAPCPAQGWGWLQHKMNWFPLSQIMWQWPKWDYLICTIKIGLYQWNARSWLPQSWHQFTHMPTCQVPSTILEHHPPIFQTLCWPKQTGTNLPDTGKPNLAFRSQHISMRYPASSNGGAKLPYSTSVTPLVLSQGLLLAQPDLNIALAPIHVICWTGAYSYLGRLLKFFNMILTNIQWDISETSISPDIFCYTAVIILVACFCILQAAAICFRLISQRFYPFVRWHLYLDMPKASKSPIPQLILLSFFRQGNSSNLWTTPSVHRLETKWNRIKQKHFFMLIAEILQCNPNLYAIWKTLLNFSHIDYGCCITLCMSYIESTSSWFIYSQVWLIATDWISLR